jgi:hypothetical protein
MSGAMDLPFAIYSCYINDRGCVHRRCHWSASGALGKRADGRCVIGAIRRTNYYGDNEAALSLIKNYTAGVSRRSKHIDVKYKFLRDRYMRGDINAQYVPTSEQLADSHTKATTCHICTGTGVKNARDKIGLGVVAKRGSSGTAA